MYCQKLPSGNWRAVAYVYDEDGKRRGVSFTRPSKKEATHAAQIYESTHSVIYTDTLGYAISSYISSRSPVCSPSTIRGYNNILSGLRTYPIINYRLANITDKDMQDFINDLSREKSAKTIYNYWGLISSACRQKGITFKVKLPQKQHSELYVPSAKEMQEVLKKASGREIELPILLGIMGLRRGEVCALDPEEDLDGNVLHVQRAMVLTPKGKWITKQPKTYSSDRYIMLPEEIASKLRGKPAATRMNPQTLTKRFEDFLVHNGFQKFHFHALRHFMVSYLHSQGIPDAYIQKVGGWQTDYVMKRVYRQTLEDQNKKMQKKANKAIEELWN